MFSIAPGLYLVDWRRGMGDAMSFYKFYQASYTRADQTYMMRSPVVTNLHYGRRACARASPASSRAANRNDAAAARCARRYNLMRLDAPNQYVITV